MYSNMLRWLGQRSTVVVLFFVVVQLASLGSSSAAQQPSIIHKNWSYKSSALESTWYSNLPGWTQRYCERVDSFQPNITRWIHTTKKLMHSQRLGLLDHNGISSNLDNSVFSTFTHTRVCNGHEKVFISWIEPLSFGLRHPSAPCKDDLLLSREYLLITSATELRLLNCGAMPRTFYFDLGASTYLQGGGGPSQSWFIDAYGRRGIHFDRMLLWEAGPMKAADILKEVPKELLSGYQYFNVPVTADPADPGNPLNILKQITKPEDFVVLKMDIDNGPLEKELYMQLKNDPELYGRVDEFFFEHHVNFEAMYRWWPPKPNEIDVNLDLKGSYDLFMALRELGIRAHGWP